MFLPQKGRKVIFTKMVYIKSIDKNILPYYISPFKDELFSSWFCRLSVKHNLKPQSFIQNYFDYKIPFWNRDIDLVGKKGIIDFFLNHTKQMQTYH